MKKTLYILLIAILAVTVSCSVITEPATTNPGDENVTVLNINGRVIDADTKTTITEDVSVFHSAWVNGNAIRVDVDNLASKKTATYNSGTGYFTCSITGLSEGDHTVNAAYPSSTGVSSSKYSFTVPTSQTMPGINAIDESADFLLAQSKVVSVDGSGNISTVDMDFRRAVAIVKIIPVDGTTDPEKSLSGLKISSITITSGVNMKTKIKVTPGAEDDSYETNATVFSVSYAGSDFEFNANKSGTDGAYIVFVPGKFTKGKSLRFDVETDDDRYTISKTIASLGSDITFGANELRPITVTFDNSCVEVATAPTITVADITGVSVSGVSSTQGVTFTNASGWTPSIDSFTGCVSAASLTSTSEISVTPSDNTINYTVGAYDALVGNTGTIVVKLTKAGESPVTETVNVTQNISSTVTKTWDFQAWAKTKTSCTEDYYYYNSSTNAFAESATTSISEELYFSQSLQVNSGSGFYYANISGGSYKMIIPTSEAGTLTLWATLNKKSSETGSATINVSGGATPSTSSLSTANGDYYDTSASLCGAKTYEYTIDGSQSEIQIYKSGSNGIRIYKVEFEYTE